MVNILGGVGLIVLILIFLFIIDRLFYVLFIIGLVMIVRGFIMEKME